MFINLSHQHARMEGHSVNTQGAGMLKDHYRPELCFARDAHLVIDVSRKDRPMRLHFVQSGSVQAVPVSSVTDGWKLEICMHRSAVLWPKREVTICGPKYFEVRAIFLPPRQIPTRERVVGIRMTTCVFED
jgi:hypothetical protein